MAENILAHISGRKIFQYEICGVTQQTSFSSFFPIFGAKKYFPGNQDLSHTACKHMIYMVSSTMPIFRKN